jgi:uncharacterized repeat protein (TIGR01451 family)
MVVQAVKKATGTSKVILVGHSMGGLAARAYLQGQGRWDGLRSMAYSNDVASAITIGAPHQGSPLANILVVPFPTGWLSWLNPISVAIEALETGSPALAALNSGTLPPGVNYVSIIADGVPIIGLPGQTGDGIVSGQSQDLANAVSVAGLRYLAVPLQIYPQYFWSPLETHSYEPSDYQVWDQLIRQISTPAGLPSDLLLRVTASPNPVRPGERVQLVYTISNQGSNDLPGAELRMITPSYTEWADGSDAVPLPDWWSNLASPGDERIWTLGTLPAGQSRNILVSAGVWSGSSAPTNLTTLYTAALATSSRGDSSSSSGVVVVDDTPPLRVALTADQNPVAPGQVLAYTVRYANQTTVTAAGVLVRARIPPGTTLVSASDGGVRNGDWVEWTLGTVGSGANGQRSLSVQVGGGTGNGAVLAGQAEVSGSAGQDAAARAEIATVVSALAPLGVTLTATPDPVRPGEVVNYVMTVVNHGISDLSNVKVGMTTPSYAQWADGSDAVPLPDWWSNLATAGDGRVWTLGTVPAGQSRNVLVGVGMNTGIRKGTTVQADAVAWVSGSAGSSGSSVVVVDDTPPLRVALTADQNPVAPGQVLAYTVRYANQTTVTATGVLVRARVPPGTALVSASDGGVLNGQWVEWGLDSVAAGANGRWALSVQVGNGLSNGALLTGQVEITGTAGVGTGSRAEIATVVSAVAPLGVTLTATPDPVRPGEVVNYVMTVVNHGISDLSNVKVGMITPSYAQWADGSDAVPLPDWWSNLATAGDGRVWTLGTLAVGRSRTVTVRETTTSSAPYETMIRNVAIAWQSGAACGAQAQLASLVGVLEAPVVTSQPSSQTLMPGSTERFTVGATGTAPLTYQWRKDGVDIAGATNATLLLTNVQSAQAGAYSVVVSNIAGSATSVVATLSVLAPPSITNPRLVGHNFSVLTPTAVGPTYTLEYENSLTGGAWSAAQTLPGTGGVITLTDTAATSSARFYRIRVE